MYVCRYYLITEVRNLLECQGTLMDTFLQNRDYIYLSYTCICEGGTVQSEKTGGFGHICTTGLMQHFQNGDRTTDSKIL